MGGFLPGASSQSTKKDLCITTKYRLWTHSLSFCSRRLTSRLTKASVLKGTPEWIPPAGSLLVPVLQITNGSGVLWGLLCLWGCAALSRRRSMTLKVSFHSFFIPVSYIANSSVSVTSVCVCMDDRLFLRNKNFDNFTDNLAGHQGLGGKLDTQHQVFI